MNDSAVIQPKKHTRRGRKRRSEDSRIRIDIVNSDSSELTNEIENLVAKATEALEQDCS
jgi:hypothetical protein